MTGAALRKARREQRLTQAEAAARLGISQPYLALLESGKRPLTSRVARRAVRLWNVSATLVPCDRNAGKYRVTTDILVKQLSALRYPGFAYLKTGWVRNPAEVLVAALEQEDLDSRVAEALPWILLKYPDLDRDWLLRETRQRGLTNRLGFVVSLALRVEERRGKTPSSAYRALASLEKELQKGRLAAEFTFGRQVTSENQKKWVRENRSAEAKHWRVLTTWKPEHLQYE